MLKFIHSNAATVKISTSIASHAAMASVTILRDCVGVMINFYPAENHLKSDQNFAGNAKAL